MPRHLRAVSKNSPAPITSREEPSLAPEVHESQIIPVSAVRPSKPLSLPPSSGFHSSRPRVERLPSAELEVDTAPASQSAPVPTVEVPRAPSDSLVFSLSLRLQALGLFPDALTAGRLCIEVIEELVPCRAIYLHVFDHRSGDYVLADFTGPEGEAGLLTRSTQDDPLLAVLLPIFAMTDPGANAVVCNDLYNDLSGAPIEAVERFARMGGARRVLLAPVRTSGRTYAVIELVDPTSDVPFEAWHERAVTFAAARYAEYLRTHGAVLEMDVIARHAFDR
jgi:hypothetical protein